MVLLKATEKRYLQSLGLLSALCLALFVCRMLLSGSTRYWFIPENLLLAWLALLFSWLLVKNLKNKRWLGKENIFLSLVWILFLPNTWYVLTDFIHVYGTGEISQIYDIVLMFTLAIVGFCLGFTSLYLIHKQLYKRFSESSCNLLVLSIILLASFGIYLGRDLRWNSWDVIANPSGIILNVSDRVIDPLGNPRALNVTGLFFVLLSVTYFAIWMFLRPTTEHKKLK